MNVAVLFGGRNTEHDVSIITGELIVKGLTDLGHTVFPVYVSKDGEWFLDEKLSDIDVFKDNNFDTKKFKRVNVTFVKKEGKSVLKGDGLFAKEYLVDVYFPAFHGVNGEDGSIQGLFQMLGVPYVGCGVFSSSITIDKILTKLFYQRFNIPTTKFIHFTKSEWVNSSDKIIAEIEKNLTWPVFVKPSRLGSSIGISKVKEKTDLIHSIEVALHYDDRVLVEEGVDNLLDLTVCLIGNRDNTIVSEIQQSAFSKDFFSYEDKYLNEGGAQLGNAEKQIVIPAEIEDKVTEEIKSLAQEIYKLFECRGIARVDFLYDKTFNKVYANEINTLPGTIYHHLWKKSGIELGELLTKLLDYAQEEFRVNEKLTLTFNSDILKKANSNKLKG